MKHLAGSNMRAEANKMMLGFVVRRCAAELGHEPSADELAEWANNQRDSRGEYRVFGRPISKGEAGVILRHPQRLVAVRNAATPAQPDLPARANNVIRFDLNRRR